MTARRPLADAADRRRAATDFDSNLVVVAGAGTGKTSLLVERVLVAVGTGRVSLPETAAITFTRKAAGEMRERLGDALEEMLRGAEGRGEPPDPGSESVRALLYLRNEARVPGDVLARRVLDALDALDRAAISTIDAFCADLLRSHPIEAGIEPRFEIDEGSSLDVLFEERWEPWLSAELGPGSPRADLWRRLLGRASLDALEPLARTLRGFGVPDDALASYRPADATTLLGPGARSLADSIDAFLIDATALSDTPRGWLRAACRVFRRLGDEGLEAACAAAMSEEALDRDDRPAPNKKLTPGQTARYKALAGDARSFLLALPTVDEALCADLAAAVAPFAKEFRRTALSRGKVDFQGLLFLARKLLRDHPMVRESLKRRYRMILVDEFQDTDPVQYEIVLFLAEREGESAGDAYATRLAPGKLFIVGDPKQSIYRFRGADYSAFERAVHHVEGQGGARLALVSNFRSIEALVGPVNRLFADGGSWDASPYQPGYEPIDAVKRSPPGAPAVELWTIPPGSGLDARARRLAEGRALACRIQRLRDEEHVAFGEIMVLFRALTSVEQYLRPLREAGIPFVAGGGKTFLERPEVGQLLAVMRALAQPADAVALLAFLRSPAGAVPDTELAAHAVEAGEIARDVEPDAARFPRLARALAFLRDLEAETRGMPADAVIRHVVRRTRLIPLGAFAFEGPQRVANLRKLEAKAAEVARDGSLTLLQVVDALDDARGADVESESPLADDRSDAVRILSVHGAKGLESRVVFVPDLGRQENRGARAAEPEAAWLETPAGPSLALRIDASTRNTARLWIEAENRRHEAAESLRLLYVACTRAKERLVLLASPDPSGGAWIDPLASWGYGPAAPPADRSRLARGEVLHRVIDGAAVAPRARDATLPDSASALAAWDEARLRLRSATAPPFAFPSAAEADEADFERRDPEAPETAGPVIDRSVARAVGVVMHRWLERFGDGGVPPPGGVLARLSAAAAAELGADASEVERDAGGIAERFLASPLAGLLRQVRVVGREVALLHPKGDGTVWRGRIDLVYEDAGSSIVVADYKTDADEEGIETRYAAQLGVYREAVRAALGLPEPPRAELWLLRSGRRVVAA